MINSHLKFSEIYDQFLIAQENGNEIEIANLIKIGIGDLNNNIRDENGNTLFLWAVIKNYSSLVERLINSDIDINQININENTALHLAIINHHNEMARFLIVHGADIDAQNKYKETPLHWSVSLINNFYIIKKLIDAGADVNIQSNNGTTILHYAVRDNEFETVKLLINNGANPNIKDKYNKTALEMAQNPMREALIPLLMSWESIQQHKSLMNNLSLDENSVDISDQESISRQRFHGI